MNNKMKKLLLSIVFIIFLIVAFKVLIKDGSLEVPESLETVSVEITAATVEGTKNPETTAALETVGSIVNETTAESGKEPIQLVTLAPEGEDLHFKNKERLEEHFEKHNEDFGYASAEEYEAGANAVIHNPNALSKLEGEDGDYVYFLEDTGEFVIVSPKKVIRTYYKADRAYFDRQ